MHTILKPEYITFGKATSISFDRPHQANTMEMCVSEQMRRKKRTATHTHTHYENDIA